MCIAVLFFQAEDGIRGLVRSRGLGDVYKRQELDCRGLGDRPHLVADVVDQRPREGRARRLALAQDAVGLDDVAAQLVGHTDDRRLGHGRVADQGALDLGCAQPIAGDLDHVVDTADDPDVAVLVLAGAVAGQIPALLLVAAPVLLPVAARIPCLLSPSPSPRTRTRSRMTSSP